MCKKTCINTKYLILHPNKTQSLTKDMYPLKSHVVLKCFPPEINHWHQRAALSKIVLKDCDDKMAEVGVSPTCASHEQVSSLDLQVSSKSQVTVVRVKQVKSSHCSGQASQVKSFFRSSKSSQVIVQVKQVKSSHCSGQAS